MKLSKTSWLMLTIGIFIIAFASLGIARFQQVQEQNQLEAELSVAERRLDNFQLEQFYSQKNELEEQLDRAISQLKAAKDNLGQSIESIEVTDSLFEIVKACGVEVTEISSSGIASDKLEGITCSILRLAIRVEGDVPNLISFITKLNDDFTSGVVKSAEITIPETAGADKSLADIQLVVYTYRGG